MASATEIITVLIYRLLYCVYYWLLYCVLLSFCCLFIALFQWSFLAVFCFCAFLCLFVASFLCAFSWLKNLLLCFFVAKNRKAGFRTGLSRLAEAFSLDWLPSSPRQPHSPLERILFKTARRSIAQA